MTILIVNGAMGERNQAHAGATPAKRGFDMLERVGHAALHRSSMQPNGSRAAAFVAGQTLDGWILAGQCAARELALPASRDAVFGRLHGCCPSGTTPSRVQT